jgi:hypothetical protein
MFSRVPRRAIAAGLFIVQLSCASIAYAVPELTFKGTGLAGTNAGTHTNVSAVGLLYNNAGVTVGGFTPGTFGNSFTVQPTANGSYDSAFIIGGIVNNNPIAAGSTINISFDFSLAKTGAGNVTWKLRFADEINAPAMSLASSTEIATGLLSSASNTFTGSGTYTFTSGVSVGADTRTFLEVIYTGSIGDNITGTMTDNGYGGSGITIGSIAIPEPSTYALLLGLGVMGVVGLRRYRASRAA